MLSHLCIKTYFIGSYVDISLSFYLQVLLSPRQPSGRVLASSAGGPAFSPQSKNAPYQRSYKIMVPVVPLYNTQHEKRGKYGLFLTN